MSRYRHLAVLAVAASWLAVCAVAQITPSDDAHISSVAPTINYGGSGSLLVQSGGATGFIRFDLSGLPPGLTSSCLSKATLKIFVSAVTASGTFDVDRVTGAWTEKTINGNMQPSLGSSIVSGVSIGTFNKNTYLLVDITPAMGEWLDGVNPNYGIALVPGPAVAFAINSKENRASSHAPELDLVLKRWSSGIARHSGATGSTRRNWIARSDWSPGNARIDRAHWSGGASGTNRSSGASRTARTPRSWRDAGTHRFTAMVEQPDLLRGAIPLCTGI